MHVVRLDADCRATTFPAKLAGQTFEEGVRLLIFSVPGTSVAPGCTRPFLGAHLLRVIER